MTATMRKEPQAVTTIPGFDSLDFDQVDLYLPEPYDGEQYSPNCFMLQSMCFHALLPEPKPTGRV